MATILVVDDDPSIRSAVASLLVTEGHRVIECADGISTLTAIQVNSPDLILLDLSMPGLSGESIAGMLKSDESTRLIPVIILTGDDDAKTQCRLLELGVDDFLGKPCSRPHLTARIRSLLRAKALNDQLLDAFRAVEAMEGMSMEVIRRVTDDPQSPVDLLEISLGQCVGGVMGPGAPTHIFVAPDGEGEIEGRLLWYDPATGTSKGTVRLSKRRLKHLLSPYKQREGVYWAIEASPVVLGTLWPSVPKDPALVGVLEQGFWLFAGGYTHAVGVHDGRWLASVARQYKLFGAHLEQVAATEQAFVYAMEALARAAEVHEDGTGAHIRRVNKYSEFLARALGCPDPFVRSLSQSAMMHDVGKIHISREILMKPGKLTEAEFALIRQHPESGAKILGDSPKLAMARDIALCHHERWDGTGYPRGLKGEEIPLSARIATLADIYDALRTTRPYKPALSHAETMHIFRVGDFKTRREHFDPRCLEALFDVDRGMEEVFAGLQDLPD